MRQMVSQSTRMPHAHCPSGELRCRRREDVCDEVVDAVGETVASAVGGVLALCPGAVGFQHGDESVDMLCVPMTLQSRTHP